MAPARRRHIGASPRRRRDEDGEDENSMAGDLEDDSLSEGSVVSHQEDEDADGEGSEGSDDEATRSAGPDKAKGSQLNGDGLGDQPARHRSMPPRKPGLKATMSDTEAMLNGLKVSDESGEVTEVHFDDIKEDREFQTGRTSAPPTEPRREISAGKKRRENEKYLKEREQNPAFVPTRGSFFLHDKRTTEIGSNGYRPSFNKAKSRPYGLIVDGNARRNSLKPDASEGQWAHDLHDTVAGDMPSAPKHPSSSNQPNPALPVPTAPRSSPPNRSFSSTTLVGNVPVVVFLPGMARPISFPAVPKKQHTRLPQHRPPLRRDKPVRISVPGQTPRYIFPSTERSFIFIPRALRPNQHGYRGRGRGGFYGGRRPSYYPNSTYTPSVLSRRSSLAQEGYPSPAASVYSRPAMAPMPSEPGKPVVRLPPPPPRQPIGVPPGPGLSTGPAGPMPLVQVPPPVYRESGPVPIPMHQPRPQKAVSVADIESPASFPFNPTQPPPEQPFYNQVPLPATGAGPDVVARGPPSQASGTPLSHIPERAIHAQPFQPFGYQQPSGFYPPSYPPGGPGGAVYYPPSGLEYQTYNGPVGPGASMPTFAPSQQPMPYGVSGTSSSGQPSQPGTVAHESGGTVYFYDANQMYSSPAFGTPGSGPGGVVGMGGMMTPPGTTYYYPQPPGGGGGVYYGHQ